MNDGKTDQEDNESFEHCNLLLLLCRINFLFYLLKISLNNFYRELRAAWPDKAIFEKCLRLIFTYKSCPNITFWLFEKRHFSIKIGCGYFWATYGKFGLLFRVRLYPWTSIFTNFKLIVPLFIRSNLRQNVKKMFDGTIAFESTISRVGSNHSITCATFPAFCICNFLLIWLYK